MEERIARLEKKLNETESKETSKESPKYQVEQHTQEIKLSLQQTRFIAKHWGNGGYLGYLGRDGKGPF